MVGRITWVDHKAHYFLDGTEVTQKKFRKAFPPMASNGPSTHGNRPWSKKLKSDALAVHPDQVKEVMERNRKHGLHINYDSDGLPILEDRKQRAELIRLEKAYDRDAGYGDPAPNGAYIEPPFEVHPEI